MAVSSRSRSAGRRGGQQVAGDLLRDEPVERHVGVHRVDHVVAVLPGVRVGDVPRRAGRLGIAGHVEPVPAPALAELRRGEQAIDDAREGVRRGVLEECVDLAGVGGRPVRSNVTRRSRVTLSASSTGSSPASSSLARMKRSSGSRGHEVSLHGRQLRGL